MTGFIHFGQNIKRKLQELQYPESAIKEVLGDIFGCQQGSTFSEGLVDSNSDEELMRSCVSWKKGGSNWKQLITLNPVFMTGLCSTKHL